MIIWETGECQYYVKSVKSFETSPRAKLINPNISSVDSISGALAGRVPANLNRHSVREERLSKPKLFTEQYLN